MNKSAEEQAEEFKDAHVPQIEMAPFTMVGALQYSYNCVKFERDKLAGLLIESKELLEKFIPVEAERDRYKAALEKLIKLEGTPYCGCRICGGEPAADIARDALGK